MRSRVVSLQGLPNFVMALHHSGDRYVSDEIEERGIWEPLETRLVRRLLERPFDFYDVGANIGWYSVVGGLSLGDSGGVVHSFEPAMINQRLLVTNIEANALTNVRVNRFALGRRSGEAVIYLADENQGDHRLEEASESRRTEQIMVRRFDDYYRPSVRAPLLKLDTQGSELAIVDGMGRWLNEAPGLAMIMEFWPHGLRHEPDGVERLIGLLGNVGLEPMVLVEDDAAIYESNWSDVAAAAATTLAPETGHFVNLLVHRPEDGLRSHLTDFLAPGTSKWVPAAQ